MAVAFNTKPHTIITTAGWADYVEWFLGSVAAPDTAVETATVRMVVNLPGLGPADLSAYLSKAGGRVSWNVPRAVTAAWLGGDGSVEINVRPGAEAVDRHTYVGKLKILGGL